MICVVVLGLYVAAAFGQGFQIFMVGGSPWEERTYLHEALGDDEGCPFAPFEREVLFKPFAGFMDNNFTVCAGTANTRCHFLEHNSVGYEWKPSMSLSLRHSSMVSTFSGDTWTFFGGVGNNENFHVWKSGMDVFTEHELGFSLNIGACSARVNQTHAIVSNGNKFAYLYEEDKQLFTRLASGSKDVYHAACGLVFHEDSDFQFLTAGGILEVDSDESYSDKVEVFSLTDSTWSEGPHLPEIRLLAASVQFQNSFLIVGGRDAGYDTFSTILSYHEQDGWIQLSKEMAEGSSSLGATAILKGRLRCPSTTTP